MAVIPAINIPNPDATDALAALETRWRGDTLRRIGQEAYDALPGPQKARELLVTMIRISTRNYRRERAERAILTTEPDIT